MNQVEVSPLIATGSDAQAEPHVEPFRFKISIVMPALNEEKNVSAAVMDAVSSFERIGCSGEIIIVNDGSTDKTEEVVRGLMKKYPFIRVVVHDKPKGIGAAFWEGVAHAEGELVTLLPGDGENDSYEILRYMPLMDHVDIIVPFIYNKQVRSWQRRLISKVYKAVINISFRILLNYMNGTVMYRRSVLQTLTLKNNGFFYQAELLIKALRRGYL
ncbi:MAG TPA: glycosyltransferase family 2 protein, partial [Bacteroidota bacterium]|nr:glycosyltransferase family 2 protein [Bacteroidota bacterium]